MTLAKILLSLAFGAVLWFALRERDGDEYTATLEQRLSDALADVDEAEREIVARKAEIADLQRVLSGNVEVEL